MRLLASGDKGDDGDVPIVAGESGAAAFVCLVLLLKDREHRALLGLDGDARVLRRRKEYLSHINH